jgi:hypothetical protein
MSAFLESPIPILVLGGIVEAILLIALFWTGRGVILYVMAGMLAVVGIGLVVERLVVTDKKRITATLEDARAAAQANDPDRLLTNVDPAARPVWELVKMAFRRIEFTEARIRNLEITVLRQAKPPAAQARFTALAAFKDRSGEFPDQQYPTDLVVQLHLAGDRWLITDVKEQKLGKL